MRMTMTKVRGGVFGLVVAGALGFGGSQALAAPAPEQAAVACNPEACTKRCQAQHGPFAGGFCSPFGLCECAV